MSTLSAGMLTNFSGGPNFRDAPSELAAAETYGSWNITYDERGGATSRLGYTKRNLSALGTGSDFIVNDFYSHILGAFLTQSGKKLYKGDNTTSVKTFTTADCVTYAEMGARIIVGHPVDGMFFSTDGSAWTLLVDTRATAVLTEGATPFADGDTATVNNVTYRIKTVMAVANDVQRGGSGDATLDALVKAVNQSGISGTDYFAGTVAPANVTAGARSGSGAAATVTFTAAAGTSTAANSYLSVTTGGHSTFSGATFGTGAGTQAGFGTNAPATANCLCVWQSKLFVGMSDGSIHWSALSDPLTWAANDFNEIWEVDRQPVVALSGGSGQDILGRPALLAFKQESVYRVNSAATGSYTVVSSSEGAAGPKAVVGVGARVCWIGKRGVFWWRQDQAGPVNASDQLQPLWQATQLSIANQAGWCAGRRQNRALFSCSTINSGANDLALELHPDEGWIAPRSDAVTCYATSSDVNELTCGGSPIVAGQTYKLATGGTDDGTAISWWFQTRWLVPNGGFQAMLWQLRVHGRGQGTLAIRQNYESSGGTEYPFNLDPTFEPLYDNGLQYDSGVTYAVIAFQQTEAFYDLGALRQFSLYFSGASTTTVTGRTLFGNAPAPTVGSFGIYALEYLFVPLGLS